MSSAESDWGRLAGRLRVAAWAAFAGISLQLAGVGWDTLQHHWDPDLASRESVASLTNPSHLLIALGMSIAALGVGYGLYCLASSRLTPRPSTGAAIAVVVLATLWIGTASVALRTGGISGRHDHGSAASSKPHGHSGAARDTGAR